MCKVLKISRSTYYKILESSNKSKSLKAIKLENDVVEIFKSSRRNYGTRRIKKELEKLGKKISRRKIGKIMREKGLVSNYTVAQYKKHKTIPNDELVKNIVNRNFDDRNYLEVVVSDLTYVRVAGTWNYVCLILDLHNREIIGFSAGKHKDALLVYEAFAKIHCDLSNISIFHTDRGNEFKNNIIDGLLQTFKINRSLSKKGCPYDNSVAESAFKTFKIEFIYQSTFYSLEQLQLELFDYVNWYNNIRLHSSLNYLTPIEYRKNTLKKIV